MLTNLANAEVNLSPVIRFVNELCLSDSRSIRLLKGLPLLSANGLQTYCFSVTRVKDSFVKRMYQTSFLSSSHAVISKNILPVQNLGPFLRGLQTYVPDRPAPSIKMSANVSDGMCREARP